MQIDEMSHIGQTRTTSADIIIAVTSRGDKTRFTMRTNYLHLSAFTCDECDGPVISASRSTRETEIQRATDIRQIGSVCLLCGKRYVGLPSSGIVRHIAPFEWHSGTSRTLDAQRGLAHPRSASTPGVGDSRPSLKCRQISSLMAHNTPPRAQEESG